MGCGRPSKIIPLFKTPTPSPPSSQDLARPPTVLRYSALVYPTSTTTPHPPPIITLTPPKGRERTLHRPERTHGNQSRMSTGLDGVVEGTFDETRQGELEVKVHKNSVPSAETWGLSKPKATRIPRPSRIYELCKPRGYVKLKPFSDEINRAFLKRRTISLISLKPPTLKD